jgi:hypothetical protein
LTFITHYCTLVFYHTYDITTGNILSRYSKESIEQRQRRSDYLGEHKHNVRLPFVVTEHVEELTRLATDYQEASSEDLEALGVAELAKSDISRTVKGAQLHGIRASALFGIANLHRQREDAIRQTDTDPIYPDGTQQVPALNGNMSEQESRIFDSLKEWAGDNQ